MIGFVLMGVVIVAAAVVVALLLKNLKNGDDAVSDAVVPITDLTELKRDIKPRLVDTLKPATPLKSADSGSHHKSTATSLLSDDQNTSILDSPILAGPLESPVSTPPVGPGIDEPAIDKVSPEALNLNQRIAELEGELKLISDKAVDQAEQSVKLIKALMLENETLKKEQAKAPVVDPAQEEKQRQVLADWENKYQLAQNQLEVNSSKVKQLEDQIEGLKKELEKQTTESNSTIARLKNDSESAIRDHEQIIQKNVEKQLQEAVESKTQELTGQLEAVKQEKQTIALAKEQIEGQLSSVDQKYQKELSQLQEALEARNKEFESLQNARADMDTSAQKTKELNAQLISKVQSLQYELTKNRAQINGLEKMCENLKIQLEAATAKKS